MATTTPTMTTTTTTPGAPATSKQRSFFDWMKPRRGVAIARLKNNGFAMVVALLVTQLSPITPSPLTCIWVLFTGGPGMSRAALYACWIELALFAVLSANIIQAYIGLRYPPPPCEPLASPVKRAELRSSPAPRPLKTFTPIPSKRPAPFASSFASSYAPSPLSTPSRIVNYKSPLANSPSSTSPFLKSMNSSSSSLMSSPLAYRARRPQSQSVRPLDGSLLNQLKAIDDDDY